jgi:hypothetical protein
VYLTLNNTVKNNLENVYYVVFSEREKKRGKKVFTRNCGEPEAMRPGDQRRRNSAVEEALFPAVKPQNQAPAPRATLISEI